MTKPNLLIFASGTQDGGGSGFEKLVEAARNDVLCAHIVGVVSNHQTGGVRKRADRLGVNFIYSPKGRSRHDYENMVITTEANYVALSGWLGRVEGLDPRTTFNIHPALLPSPFGGKGMHGHHVHEAVMQAYARGEVTHSGVTMHFVTPDYDSSDGIFFRRKVEIFPDDTAESLARRVNAVEHEWQARMTNLVVQGHIWWDDETPGGVQGATLIDP